MLHRVKKIGPSCNCKSEIGNVCNAVEDNCRQAMKIVNHHANARFDWLISGTRALILQEKQFPYCLGNTQDLRVSINTEDLRFSINTQMLK